MDLRVSLGFSLDFQSLFGRLLDEKRIVPDLTYSRPKIELIRSV